MTTIGDKKCLFLGTAQLAKALDYIDIFTIVTGHVPFVSHHEVMNHPSGPYYDIWDNVTKDEEKQIRDKAKDLDLPTTLRGNHALV